MKLAALLAAVAIGVLASAGTASATSECRGLNPCVPVAGPWVVVPTAKAPTRPRVEFQLTCPPGFVVAGIDAELTDRAIDLSWLATSGTPIGPGISSSRSVVFVGWFTGTRARAPSFRPHVGCIPGAGGGGRVSTAVPRFLAPGHPVTRRVVTVAVVSTRSVRVSCRSAERLVGWSAARGFATVAPPSAAAAASLSATVHVRGAGVIAVARARAPGAVIQLAALCAGGT
jgi:hypothetical protein